MFNSPTVTCQPHPAVLFLLIAGLPLAASAQQTPPPASSAQQMLPRLEAPGVEPADPTASPAPSAAGGDTGAAPAGASGAGLDVADNEAPGLAAESDRGVEADAAGDQGAAAPAAVAGSDASADGAADNAADETAEEAPESDPFDVWEIRVGGNTMLPPVAVERVVYPFLGPGGGLEAVDGARVALEQAYRDAGYPTVLVSLPEQEVIGGIVRLEVTEGTIDRIRVTGSRYFSNGRIRALVPSLEAGEVPYLPALQSDLNALNGRSTDRTVTPVLRAGREPGTVEVELQVKDELPVHATLEVNDRATVDTSATRVSAKLAYDNVWQREHSFSLQYQTAPEEPEETQVIAATFLLRPSETDRLFAFYAVDTDSDIVALGDISVLGVGTIFGMRGVFPLTPTDSIFHNLVFGVDYKDFDDTVGPEGEPDPLRTPISYINFVANWTGVWRGPRAITQFDIGANFGVRGLGNSTPEFEDKRLNARPNYLYFTGSLEREQPLPGDFRFYTQLRGQITEQPIISNEQLTAGGALSVRGYFEAEQLGDYGAVVNLELRTPSLSQRFSEAISDLYLFAFIDWAGLRIYQPLPGQDGSYRLESAGLGLRMAGAGRWDLAVDWAWPLQDTNRTQADDQRFHVMLKYGF